MAQRQDLYYNSDSDDEATGTGQIVQDKFDSLDVTQLEQLNNKFCSMTLAPKKVNFKLKKPEYEMTNQYQNPLTDSNEYDDFERDESQLQHNNTLSFYPENGQNNQTP